MNQDNASITKRNETKRNSTHLATMQDLGKDSTVGVKGHTRAGTTQPEAQAAPVERVEEGRADIVQEEALPLVHIVVTKVVQGGIRCSVNHLWLHVVLDVLLQCGAALVIPGKKGRYNRKVENIGENCKEIKARTILTSEYSRCSRQSPPRRTKNAEREGINPTTPFRGLGQKTKKKANLAEQIDTASEVHKRSIVCEVLENHRSLLVVEPEKLCLRDGARVSVNRAPFALQLQVQLCTSPPLTGVFTKILLLIHTFTALCGHNSTSRSNNICTSCQRSSKLSRLWWCTANWLSQCRSRCGLHPIEQQQQQ